MSADFTPVFADLVRVFTDSSGAGAFVPGVPVEGYRGFEALNPGDRFYYSVASTAAPPQWEVGRGTLLDDGRIGRQPLVSSANGDLVDFAAGAKTIAITVAGEWFAGAPTLEQADSRYQRTAPMLQAIAEVGAAGADRLLYYTGAVTAGLTSFTPFGRSLVAGADAAAVRATLALGGAAVKPTGTSGDAVPVLNGGPTNWAAGATFGGSVLASGIVKGRGLEVAGTGAGAELLYDVGAGVGGVGAFDRSAGVPKAMVIYGSAVWIWVGASNLHVATFDTGGLEVAGLLRARRLRIDQEPVPATGSDAGAAGEIRWDDGHLYVCVGPNSWKRAALSSW